MLGYSNLSYAAQAQTELSQKAANLKMGMSHPQVLRLLGNPTWAITQSDEGEWALPDNRIRIELWWENGNCNPVSVAFNSSMQVSGWDEGRALCVSGKYTIVPDDTLSCQNADRKKLCKK